MTKRIVLHLLFKKCVKLCNSNRVECSNLVHPLFVVAALLQFLDHLRKGVGTGEDAPVGHLEKKVKSFSLAYEH